MMKARDEVAWFDTPSEWRAWLEANHRMESEIWVGLRKKYVPVGITWQEAVDEAPCYGWIDGLTHSVDGDGYTCRITPRKPRSIWSLINIKWIEELIAEGRVHLSGLRVYRERDLSRAGLYSFEQDEAAFDTGQLTVFEADGRPRSGSSPSRQGTAARRPGGSLVPSVRKPGSVAWVNSLTIPPTLGD